MRFGIEVVTLGELADPRKVVGLAEAPEAAGSQALSVGDHLAFVWGVPSADPWVTLSAVAASTERMRLITGVTPLPRPRPHVLPHTLATLDNLSGGHGAGPAELIARIYNRPDRHRVSSLNLVSEGVPHR
jgi:alkanesulfonate monooxygenase SsuD/methylene tetrahydromethanopterin reductase-like flavin-dependent oxidoreductase (luciferase family)